MNDNASEVLDHLAFLTRHIESANMPAVTMLMLIELQLPFGTAGFDHLETGIVAFGEDPVKTLAAGIYETIIAHYDIEFTKDAVEQAMRTAISNAWKIKNLDDWKRYFPQLAYGNMKKPANTDFITRLGRYLQLWKMIHIGGGRYI